MRLALPACAVTCLLLTSASGALAQSNSTVAQTTSTLVDVATAPVTIVKRSDSRIVYIDASLGDSSDHYFAEDKGEWWVRTNITHDGWPTLQWGRNANGQYWMIDYRRTEPSGRALPPRTGAGDLK